MNKDKILIQCDFDGTITEEDVSFFILDAFANGDWRSMLQEYKDDKITVGSFNRQAFSMVKESKESLKKLVLEKTRIRPGLPQLLNYYKQQGFRFVIVSNGLEFYIKTILDNLGLDGVEVIAATAEFEPQGIIAKYIGPDGKELQNDFKKAYTSRFVEEGYKVIYIGNGASDVNSARLAEHAFATDTMLEKCRQDDLKCHPFSDLNDVVEGLKLLV